MAPGQYYNETVERMDRDSLNDLIDERVRYTVQYAAGNSPFYRKWFRENRIRPEEIREHADLLNLPIISGKTIRENQPPVTKEFRFRSAEPGDIYTIHETSGTSGTPKSFFFCWEDWERYAEKYARIFRSQGFSRGDRIVVCASYGMNIGANTMTLAAQKIGVTIIPTGKCSFPVRLIENYRPTGIVGSIFKLLHLAQRMKGEGISPDESSIERLIVGGESFPEESRKYLAEVWGRDVYNTYGSTEGTMCGECREVTGLHVPEDLVHIDLYDPQMKAFVPDGECGRVVLTTLLPVGEKCGTLLLNYDTEDTSVILSRKTCACGRTHMRVLNPTRESETIWAFDTPFNRVDVERGVFQPENMQYLTGEYEAFVYGGENDEDVVLRVSMEAFDPDHCDKKSITDSFLTAFLKPRPRLQAAHADGRFILHFNIVSPGTLELYRVTGRPKRLVDRR